MTLTPLPALNGQRPHPEHDPSTLEASFSQELRRLLPETLSEVLICPDDQARPAGLRLTLAAAERDRAVTTDPRDEQASARVTSVRYGDLHGLQAAMNEEVGAVVIAPFQSAEGVCPGSEAFLRAARKFATRAGALLLFDETQTGFGQTGRRFAREHADVQPDGMILSLGTTHGRLGVFVSTRRVAQGRSPDEAAGSASPLALRSGLETLRRFRDDRLWEQATPTGARLVSRLQALRHPKIHRVRGVGLLVSVELTEPSAPYGRALERCGVEVAGAGRVLRFRPSLTRPPSEIDQLAPLLKQVLDTVPAGHA